MTPTEKAILETLRALESTAKNAASGAKPDLMPIFNRLDKLAGELPRSTDPQLLHFLHRKSYHKAIALLEQMPADPH